MTVLQIILLVLAYLFISGVPAALFGLTRHMGAFFESLLWPIMLPWALGVRLTEWVRRELS